VFCCFDWKIKCILDIPDFNLPSSNDDNIDKSVDGGKLLPSWSVSIVIPANFVTLYLVPILCNDNVRNIQQKI
jgi:hypothetical protein